MKIILGSQSKSRRVILERAGFAFEARSADIDEKAIRDTDPLKLTLALAHAKADALVSKITEPALLITSDQVVACDGTIIEKPETAENVREFFLNFEKHLVEIVTAVVVTNTATNRCVDGVDVARIWFRPVPKQILEELIGEPMTYTHAGGFSVEDPRLRDYFEKIEGAKDSIMGMPLELTKRLLAEAE